MLLGGGGGGPAGGDGGISAPVQDSGEDAAEALADAGGADGPIGPCDALYLVTAWLFDTAPFDKRIVNELIHGDLEREGLLLTLGVQAGPTLLWRDCVRGEEGLLAPDPAVAQSDPLSIELEDEQRFRTEEPGTVTVHLTAADYAGADPINWTLHLAEVSGTFAVDCSTLTGRIHGAFRDDPAFSIPQGPDTDTDDDGEPDAFWMESNFVAERLVELF